MARSVLLRASLRAALAAGLAWVAGATAQDDGVVVSATRAPKAVLDVPASIDRLYGEEIREGRPQVNLSESLGRVPGIVVQNRQNYTQDLQVQSRGFGARSTFGVRGVRLVADGIPATMPDGQGQAATLPLGSAGRIEVLRGPFSALYGNASGGVIVVETQEAPESPLAEGSVYAGPDGSRRLGAQFARRLGPLNAVADWSRFETDGYRRHSAARREHLNARLRTSLGESSSLSFTANSLRQPENEDPLGLTRAQYEADPRQAGTNSVALGARKSTFQDQAGLSFVHRAGAHRFELSTYAGQRYVEQYLAIPLATQTATPTHSGAVVDLDRGYGGGALRWSAGLGEFTLHAGAEHDLMEERRKGFVNAGGLRGALRRDEDNRVRSQGLYVQAEWTPQERWTLSGGLRHSRVAFQSRDYFVVPGNGDDSGSRSYRATTPVLGLLYRLSRTTSLYGNLGRGFETPTFVELAYRSTAGAATGLNFGLQASTSRHSEVGVKTVVPGLARVNAALFGATTRNEIVVDQNAGGRSTFKNAGTTERKGFELSVESLFGGRLETRAAFTLLDAAFREGFVTSVGTPGIATAVAPGARLPGVARAFLHAEVRYRWDGGFALLEGQRKSKVAVNDANQDFAAGYTVLNAVAGLSQEAGGWRLTEYVRVDNLAGRRYAGSVIVNEANNRFFEPAPGRGWALGAQLRYQF